MILQFLYENLSICIKKTKDKQTGFTKLTKTGLIVMLFFKKICACHR